MGQELSRANVAIEREINGIEMGVLSDGTSYLTGRGLAKLCGVAASTMIFHLTNWRNGKRDGKVAQWLISHGVDSENLGIALPSKHAYSDDICMLILEYYAFEAGREAPFALARFRKLARAGLRVFVYSQLGYDPAKAVPPEWRPIHDRLLLASAPVGYFSIFKEAADFELQLVQHGLPHDSHTIPDISLGSTWSRHWKENGLEEKFGATHQWPHHYPDYYPQAASNPQMVLVYPNAALPEFRGWLHSVYLPTKYPSYLKNKVRERVLTAEMRLKLLAAAGVPQLPRDLH
jgi:hypothetical protein